MTAPTPVKLGPGHMQLGATGTTIDMSCLMQNATVSWDVDTDDDLNVLCGDTIPGARTYSATISGTVLQDLTENEGLVAFTWAHKGEALPVTFTPNDAAEATVTGTVVIDPLDVGGDEYGSVMTSDFEWAFVGEPDLAWNGTGTGDAGTGGDTGTGTTSGTAADTSPEAALV